MASALGFGLSPEIEAWNKLLKWAGLKGLLEDLGNRRFFGFNNPDPSAGTNFTISKRFRNDDLLGCSQKSE